MGLLATAQGRESTTRSIIASTSSRFLPTMIFLRKSGVGEISFEFNEIGGGLGRVSESALLNEKKMK